ncbi:MAG: DEAD/DEAH box helicase family protein [Gammaproteobacteria bacterium]|nr:DEAD/DEAH box helicase family protein [Gammaproteobacteria bacterium]
MNKKNYTEAEIRTRYITPALYHSGWGPTQVREEFYFTKGRINVRGKLVARGKRKYADYVLFIKPNIPLAVIEAKDNNHGAGEGMQQALEYAEILKVPFAFSSNGDGFVFHDATGNADIREKSLSLTEFPSPTDLWSRYRAWRGFDDEQETAVLQDYHDDDSGRTPRYYQISAINAVVEAIASGRKRILLVMATGTGKTYTAFQIIWRLWKSGKKKRILFLADRNILVDQTMANDFRWFGSAMAKLSRAARTISQENPATTDPLYGKKQRRIDTSYEIYLSLYQAITGEEEDKKIYRELSRDFFDLIVIDECHRGSAADDSAWHEILEYFSSATQIGLTATPKETEYASNIDYFGEPVFTYSLKQGINDGFLAPYKVVRVHIDLDVEGYRPEKGKVDNQGRAIEDREFSVADFDRVLVIDDRTKLAAHKITQFLKESGNRYQKSIIFCVDQEHAARMRQALVNENQNLVDENRKYVMRITGEDSEGQNELDNFADPESRHPVLVTTSRLLSTGVNVRTCRLIVLDRMIGSMTEFKQIIGRGTRIHEDAQKFYFTIIDFRGATRHFADPEFDGDPVQIYEPGDGDPIDPPDIDGNDDTDQIYDPDGDGITDTEPPLPLPDSPRRREKVYVDGVEATIVAEQIKYLGSDGKLITESLRDFTRRTLLKRFASLDEFLKHWNEADRKQTVLDEMEKEGFPMESVAREINSELDPFDLICHIVFDIEPLTRRERAEKVKSGKAFDKYAGKARSVLNALLDKYADEGILKIDDAKVLRIPPINEIGTPVELIRAFGDRDAFERAVHEIQDELYKEVA